MTRIYKSIAIIASLVCSATAGESSVESTKLISDKFSNSVEQVNTLDNIDTSINNDEVVDATHQRRELAWWNLVLQAGKFLNVNYIIYEYLLLAVSSRQNNLSTSSHYFFNYI